MNYFRLVPLLVLLLLPAIPQALHAKMPVISASEKREAAEAAPGPGLHYAHIRSDIQTNRVEAPPLRLNLASPVPGEGMSCEALRSQRTTYRVIFIAGAVIGVGLVLFGIDQAFDHLLSDSNAGAFESAAGLVLLAGSAIGYAVVIPSLTRKYKHCIK